MGAKKALGMAVRGAQLLQGLLLLTICCNVLSAEVQELGVEPTAAEVQAGLEKGAQEELNKSVIKEMKESYGAKILKDPLPEHIYGELEPHEKEAFKFIHGLTKEYEEMTGRKIVSGKIKVDDEPKNEISQTISDMNKLAKVMYAGKPPKLPSPGITSHADYAKAVVKLAQEEKLAFGGIPKATKPGGEKSKLKVGHQPEGNLPTAAEAARQASLKMHAKRAAMKKAALERAEARKLDLAAQMPVEELIQVEAEPAKPAEGKKAAAKPANKDSQDPFAIMHKRLDEIERGIANHKKNLLDTKMDELEAEAKEDTKKLDDDINNAEVNCPNKKDVACMKKRAKEMTQKAKRARHKAYDLQRAAARNAITGVAKHEQSEADNQAEQEAVFAAVLTNKASIATAEVARLERKGSRHESDQKKKVKAMMQARVKAKLQKAAEAKAAGKRAIAAAASLENADKIGFDKQGQPYWVVPGLPFQRKYPEVPGLSKKAAKKAPKKAAAGSAGKAVPKKAKKKSEAKKKSAKAKKKSAKPARENKKKSLKAAPVKPETVKADKEKKLSKPVAKKP